MWGRTVSGGATHATREWGLGRGVGAPTPLGRAHPFTIKEQITLAALHHPTRPLPTANPEDYPQPPQSGAEVWLRAQTQKKTGPQDYIQHHTPLTKLKNN